MSLLCTVQSATMPKSRSHSSVSSSGRLQRRLKLLFHRHLGAFTGICLIVSGTMWLLSVVSHWVTHQYLNLLHQPVLLLVIRLGKLVDLNFVLSNFPHDLQRETDTFSHSWQKLSVYRWSCTGEPGVLVWGANAKPLTCFLNCWLSSGVSVSALAISGMTLTFSCNRFMNSTSSGFSLGAEEVWIYCTSGRIESNYF